MLISEIEDKELRELAELRMREDGYKDEGVLSGAFSWHDTPEGHQFWSEVNRGIRTTVK